MPPRSLWSVVSVVQLSFMAPLGYSFFVALLYVMEAGTLAMVALSLWVAWCFKNRSFPSVW